MAAVTRDINVTNKRNFYESEIYLKLFNIEIICTICIDNIRYKEGKEREKNYRRNNIQDFSLFARVNHDIFLINRGNQIQIYGMFVEEKFS